MLYRTFALAALAAAPVAQDRVVIPEGCILVAEMDGPARVAADFEETRLGELLAGPRLASLFAPMQMAIEVGIRQAEQQTGGELRDLYEQLLEYSGRTQLAVKLLSDVDFQGAPDIGVVFIMGPDEEIDVEEIAALVVENAELGMPDDLVDVDAAGSTFTCMVSPDGAGVTLPSIIGEDLVMIGGSPLDAAIEAFLDDTGEPFEIPTELAATSMFARIDVSLVVDLIADALEQFGSGDAELEVMLDFLDSSGARGARSLDVSLRAVEAHAVVEGDMRFTPGTGGMLRWYQPEQRGRLSLFDLVPRQANFWGVTSFRLDAMFEFFSGMMLSIEGMEEADLERQFEEATGVRLRDDLLAHIGDEVMYLLDVDQFEAMLEDDAPDGVCYGIGLRDAAAFATTVDQMVRHAGIETMFTTEDYRGFEVHVLEEPTGSVRWVITDRVILAGIGDRGATQMRAVLDEEIARREGRAPDPFPEGIGERLALSHQDYQSITTVSIIPVIQAIAATVEREGQLPDVAKRMVQSVLGAIDKHDLDEIVGTAQVTDERMSWRMIW